MNYQAAEPVRSAFETMMSLEEIQKALDFIKQDEPNAIRELLELVKVESPTFHEEERAKIMKERFEALGLEDVHIDRGGNVVGLRKGSGNGPKVMIEGHLDTVFPFGTVKEVVQDEDGYLHAPGIGDDTRALTMLLAVLRAMNKAGIRTEGDIVFVCTSREEGLGGLGGMKDFLADNHDIDASIDIDGNNVTDVRCQATGAYTHEFHFHGIGGHAYTAFGDVANASHAAARAVAKIADFDVPSDPKTTFSVSNIHTGNDVSINAIPSEAVIKINYRSDSPEVLDNLKERIFAAVQQACDEETKRWGKDTITWDSRQISDIPAGIQPPHTPLADAAACALGSFGLEPQFPQGGCTNANISIGKGIPAVCIGRAAIDPVSPRLHLAHSIHENLYIRNSWQPISLAFLTLMMAVGVEGKTSPVVSKK